jgi:hypothetical protein
MVKSTINKNWQLLKKDKFYKVDPDQCSSVITAGHHLEIGYAIFARRIAVLHA